MKPQEDLGWPTLSDNRHAVAKEEAWQTKQRPNERMVGGLAQVGGEADRFVGLMGSMASFGGETEQPLG